MQRLDESLESISEHITSVVQACLAGEYDTSADEREYVSLLSVVGKSVRTELEEAAGLRHKLEVRPPPFFWSFFKTTAGSLREAIVAVYHL